MLYELLCDGRHPYSASRPTVDGEVLDPRASRPDLESNLAEFLREGVCSIAR